MCLYPELIRNPKYKKTKKNGGIIPPITDTRVTYVPIGCNRCIECRKQKAREWQVRLLEDIKHNKNGKFVCLTFSNESIAELSEKIQQELEGYDIDNAIAIYAVRHFLERWRKEYGKSLRHWLVTELGHKGTENLHLHGIIWTDEPLAKVEHHWKYGHIWKGRETRFGTIINYVSEATVNYMVKYMTKVDQQHKHYKQIILTSKGIGGEYHKSSEAQQNKFKEGETEERYRTRTGHKMAMPIYWRNKIYTEEEREQLWLQRLDKNERYVCGEKVKADNDKEYWGLVKWYREINRKLGYGEPPNWEQEQYEKMKRNLKIQERINAGKTKQPTASSRKPKEAQWQTANKPLRT